jgi:hypothetical protein
VGIAKGEDAAWLPQSRQPRRDRRWVFFRAQSSRRVGLPGWFEMSAQLSGGFAEALFTLRTPAGEAEGREISKAADQEV